MHDYHIAGCIVVCLAAWLPAEDPSAGAENYLARVKPVLTERCYACHGALKQEAGLRLDTVELISSGGESGPAIRRGDRYNSQIYQRITSLDSSLRMPMEGEPLTAEQAEAIGRWIDANALGPTDEQPEADPRQHWSFLPVVKPLVPAEAAGWSRNSIDGFIARNHQLHQLTPQAQADDLTLVRRLYVDLVGMPPAQTELAEISFASDRWYESLVDRLLNDPRYGERWGRHWMDVWRYSDWWGLGDQLRNSQQHIWHWRDWIIQSLNNDLPYDEMLRQMLAADELYPTEPDKLRATGFLARNYFLFNRNPWMEETVEHVSKSLLGLTMNCAKCHDHKFDPIDQVDFYRMRAFFEPYHVRLDMVPGEVDFGRDGIPRVFDTLLDTPTYVYTRGDENRPDKSAAVLPGVPKLLGFKQINIVSIDLPKEASHPELQPWVLQNYLAAAQNKIDAATAARHPVEQRVHQLRGPLALQESANGGAQPMVDPSSNVESPSAGVKEAEAELLVADMVLKIAVAERERIEALAALRGPDRHDDTESRVAAVRAQRHLQVVRAKHALAAVELKLLKTQDDQRKKVEEEIEKARLALTQAESASTAEIRPEEHAERLIGARWTPTRFLNSTTDDPAVKFVTHSSGRRRALADWITDPCNPLTARVAVNHLWNRHFGTPLVASVFDFGRKGALPTNPQLLDWLAAELMDSGWSMKHLHRLLVTSATYRLSSSSAGCEANIDRDADNRYWWRRNAIRLESQVVRDSILHLSGQLDTTMFGPPVPAAHQADSLRRSLYFFHSNNDRNQFLSIFDEASVKECYRRDQSIVPQQALAMANSQLVLKAAGLIARQVGSEIDGDEDFLRTAFETILAISPSDLELAASRQAMARWTNMEGGSMELARRMLVWSLLNHNDFVTLR